MSKTSSDYMNRSGKRIKRRPAIRSFVTRNFVNSSLLEGASFVRRRHIDRRHKQLRLGLYLIVYYAIHLRNSNVSFDDSQAMTGPSMDLDGCQDSERDGQ